MQNINKNTHTKVKSERTKGTHSLHYTRQEKRMVEIENKLKGKENERQSRKKINK